MIDGAIFDMDGTVLDSMPVWEQLTQRVLGRYGVRITRQDYETVEGCTQLGVAEYFKERYPDRLLMTAQALAEESDALITKRYAEIARPKEGILPFLTRLHQQGVPCCIATLTARRHAEKALQDRDMMRYFDFMLTIEDVGGSKREPEIYLRAAAKMRREASRCMVFEDAPYAAETAKNAGFYVCGVIDPAYAAGEAQLRRASDVVVERSFAEVADEIEDIGAWDRACQDG